MRKVIPTAIACAVLLGGCANGFSDFYRGMTKEQIDQRIGTRPSVEPKVIYAIDVKAESDRLAEAGFTLVGESSYEGAQSRRAESNAVAQAKAVGAETVVFSERDAGSRTVEMPITTPTTSTSFSSFNGAAFNPAYGSTNVIGTATTTSFGTSTTYVPMTIQRADYYAGYWVKGKPPIFGAVVAPLKPEQRRQLGSNTGMMIRVVVIGSPAFKADIFSGDDLISIGDVSITTSDDYQTALRKYAGTEVSVQILRDGQRVTKQINLAGRP
jgi:hypothetical protein